MNTDIEYHYNPPECASKSMSGKSPSHGIERLWMILYTDDILILCSYIKELEEIMKIYFNVFKQFWRTIANDITKVMVFYAPELTASAEYS